jgi:hypothetical protein
MSLYAPLVVGEKEQAFVIQLLNSAIPEWNFRECRDAPCEWSLVGSVGGLDFIGLSDYEVLFRHQGTGRVYGIVAPEYDVFEPGLSCRRVPLDPELVVRVERVLDLELSTNVRSRRVG